MKSIKKLLSGKRSAEKVERLKAEYAEKGTKVWLKFGMHCPQCGKDLIKCLQKFKEVLEVEPDFENSQVIVKGVFENGTQILLDHAHKKLKKTLTVVKEEGCGQEDEDDQSENQEEQGDQSEIQEEDE